MMPFRSDAPGGSSTVSTTDVVLMKVGSEMSDFWIDFFLCGALPRVFGTGGRRADGGGVGLAPNPVVTGLDEDDRGGVKLGECGNAGDCWPDCVAHGLGGAGEGPRDRIAVRGPGLGSGDGPCASPGDRPPLKNAELLAGARFRELSRGRGADLLLFLSRPCIGGSWRSSSGAARSGPSGAGREGAG